MHDWTVLGDVQKGDLALVLSLVRCPNVLYPQGGVRRRLVNNQLSPVQQLALGFGKLRDGTVDEYPPILLVPFDRVEVAAFLPKMQ